MLKQVISALLAVSITYTSAQCQEVAASSVIKVSKGTALQLETLQPLDSATARVGDDVPLQLMRPVTAQGIELLPAGTIFHGRVVQVKRRTQSESGLVRWKIDRIAFADSSTVPTEVFSIIEKPNDEVPDHVTVVPWFRRWCTDGDFHCKDTIELFVAVLPFMPFVFFRWLFSHEQVSTTNYRLPAHSTVGLALKKDHKVHY